MESEKHTFDRELVAALNASAGRRKPASGARFFREWFIARGKAYHFLFRRNVRVTNIQLAELSALLRHTVRYGDERSRTNDIQFMPTAKFKAMIDEIAEAFPPAVVQPDEMVQLIVKLYGDLLRRTIVIDCFSGSAAIFLPPTMEIDIKLVCAKAGYVHSCGRSIYVRNTRKARKDEFIEAVGRYVAAYRREGGEKKVFFTTFASEDFAGSEDRNGIRDVRVPVEKAAFGRDSLISVFEKLKSTYDKDLVVANPEDFSNSIKERESPNVDRTRTLWLISDRSIGDSPLEQGSRVYFICYEQQYKNANPLLVFDQLKPAWVSATTIPHDLMGAMINITRPWWPSEPALCDPFVGTGTTWLEARKFPSLTITCSDKDPVSRQLLKDNLEFFMLPADALETYLKTFQNPGSLHLTSPNTFRQPNSPRSAFLWACDLVNRNEKYSAHPPASGEQSLPSEVLEELVNAPTLMHRILFYTALRASQKSRRHSDDERWWAMFKSECEHLAHRTKVLHGIRLDESHAHLDQDLVISRGEFSLTCMMQEPISGFSNGGVPLVETRDVESLGEKLYDVIVTDPPYGLNSPISPIELAQLYSVALTRMIGALKDGGQLVLCLPDVDYIGRHSPAFTHKELIIRQIHGVADNLGLEVAPPSYVTGQAARGFLRPPYYWESERLLRRAILHFRFRKKTNGAASAPPEAVSHEHVYP